MATWQPIDSSREDTLHSRTVLYECFTCMNTVPTYLQYLYEYGCERHATCSFVSCSIPAHIHDQTTFSLEMKNDQCSVKVVSARLSKSSVQ